MSYKKNKKINVLLIGSNCKGIKEVRIGKEIKKIRKILHKSLYNFIDAPATKRDEIFEKISLFKPQIINFSGHGTFKTGPLFDEDEHFIKAIDPMEQLIDTLKKGKDNIKLIIFNVCESLTIAEKVSDFIEYTIGTTEKTDDDCAIAFAKGFYQMLVNQVSIKESFLNGKKRYEFKYIKIHNKPKAAPFQIFPDNPDNLGTFSETFEGFEKNYQEETHSDKYISSQKIETIINKNQADFERLVSDIQQRENQFNMKLVISPLNKLFQISQLEDFKVFLEKQRDLIPVPNSTYETMKIFDKIQIDNYGLYNVSSDEYMGSSIRITKEGIVLYKMHLNNNNLEKILQIHYISAYILGILNLCYRFYNRALDYTRQIGIILEIDSISKWKYSYPGEERRLVNYQYQDFIPIKMNFDVSRIQNGIGRYMVLEDIIRELMRGYECSEEHQMPDISVFKNFYDDNSNDIFAY